MANVCEGITCSDPVLLEVGEMLARSAVAAEVVESHPLTIELVGEFEVGDRHRLIDAFALAQDADSIVVDLAGCAYIDSTALEF